MGISKMMTQREVSCRCRGITFTNIQSVQLFLKRSGNCNRSVLGMKKSSNPVIDSVADFGPIVGLVKGQGLVRVGVELG